MAQPCKPLRLKISENVLFIYIVAVSKVKLSSVDLCDETSFLKPDKFSPPERAVFIQGLYISLYKNWLSILPRQLSLFVYCKCLNKLNTFWQNP